MTGSELKELRKAAGLRSGDMAKAVDISAATLSKYENGHSPIPKKVELAARYVCEKAISPIKPATERLVEAMREILK